MGCEMTGELATDYKDKTVILMTRGKELVDSMSSSALTAATRDILKAKRVRIIFDDSFDLTNDDEFKSQKIRTRNGVDIEFYAYLQCYGSRPNMTAISNSGWLDESGYIKVNKYLQVDNTENIFALGDCCNAKDTNMIYSTIKQSANSA